MKELSIKLYKPADLEALIVSREGETKFGQAIRLLSHEQDGALSQSLTKAYQSGGRYAIVLIPEDIGSRANLGRGGADNAPKAFLDFFLNMQSNRFLDCSKILLLGEIIVEDLMEKSKAGASLSTLRELCLQLDDRIAPIVQNIVAQGLEPIVIGGGNNNSLPIMQGVAEALRKKKPDAALAVVNCDAHADFRAMEGRHSGNPFTYADEYGYLKAYSVLGLHENYNSEELLTRLAKRSFRFFSYEEFAIKKTISFEESLDQAHEYLLKSGHPIGVELDLDSIENMPASAKTPFGISQAQAAQFVHYFASKSDTAYLHLSEGAPKWSEDGPRIVGKCLALQVVTYIKACEHFRRH